MINSKTIKSKKKIFKLALAIILNFKAYSSQPVDFTLEDLPIDTIKSHIIPQCDIYNSSNFITISLISKKFYEMILDLDESDKIIQGENRPGLATARELENIIRTLRNKKSISIHPSYNSEFNQNFDFISDQEVKKYFYFQPEPTIYLMPPHKKYMQLNEAIIRIEEGEAYLSEANLSYILLQGALEKQVGFCIFWDNQVINLEEYEDDWPFSKVTNINYEEHLPLPLEHDHDNLIKFLEQIEQDNEIINPEMFEEPNASHWADYMVFGYTKENEKNTTAITYRFAVVKEHNQELIDSINDGTLRKKLFSDSAYKNLSGF